MLPSRATTVASEVQRPLDNRRRSKLYFRSSHQRLQLGVHTITIFNERLHSKKLREPNFWCSDTAPALRARALGARGSNARVAGPLGPLY